MEKILSVCIAGYNIEEYIRECLDSLVMCKNRDKIEVLVINDGSKDATSSIAKEYVQKYPDIVKLIDKENGGWGSTLNAGFAIATGKYFKQLDGDDNYNTNELDEFVGKLEMIDSDIVITKYEEFNHTSGETMRIIDVFEGTDIQNDTQYYIKNIKNDVDVAMHSMTVRTSLLRENSVNILEHCFYTDVEFVIKSLSYAKTFTVLDNCIYRYRLSREGQSMSISGFKAHYMDHYKALMRNLDFIEKHEHNDATNLIEFRLNEMVASQYLIYMLIEPKQKHRDELKKFDKEIKQFYNQYYEQNNRKLTFLRRTGFAMWAYKMIVRRTSRNYK